MCLKNVCESCMALSQTDNLQGLAFDRTQNSALTCQWHSYLDLKGSMTSGPKAQTCPKCKLNRFYFNYTIDWLVSELGFWL